MKKIINIIVSLMVVFSLFGIEYSEVYDLTKLQTSKEIINLIQNDLLKWINSETILNAINKSNGANVSRSDAQIKDLDAKWINSKEIEDWMKPYFENDAAKFLKERKQKAEGLFADIFIMDYQGCLAALTDKTSDFMQGDEDKFIKTYAGKAIFIDKVKYDESTKTSSMQISLPIYDKNSKKIIGAVTITINMDKKDLLKKY